MSANTRNIIAWILQILLGAAFIMAGFQKVSHMAETVSNFDKMGMPGWFAYLIGGGELLGGIGLLIPATVRLAASGLIIIMVGAVITHITKIPGLEKGIPAMVLLVLLGLLFWLRRPAPETTA